MTLTPGQQAVFDGIIRGHTNGRIADELGLSDKTVKAHVTKILRKARLNSRCELIVAHYTNTLIEATT